MENPVPLVDVIRGEFLECQHAGHWVVVDAKGAVIDGGGNPDLTILPRSSLKPVQAIALLQSGAIGKFGLSSREIALACASHQGAEIHSSLVSGWLQTIGRCESDLGCGVQPPSDAGDRQLLRDAGRRADQTHNNCSGKHTGFLTLARTLGADNQYTDVDHPVQVAVQNAVAEMTGRDTMGHAIDGCSAPNFATSLRGLAMGMAKIATANEGAPTVQEQAASDIRNAMMTHPELVAGDGRACTRLMNLLGPKGVVKGGAEGVNAAALPGLGVGIALKITDGAERASEVALTAILVRLGVLDAKDPAVQDMLTPPVKNWRKIVTGCLRPTGTLAI